MGLAYCKRKNQVNSAVSTKFPVTILQNSRYGHCGHVSEAKSTKEQLAIPPLVPFTGHIYHSSRLTNTMRALTVITIVSNLGSFNGTFSTHRLYRAFKKCVVTK